MRWHILKTLRHKEALRHATNRGGLALAGLLVTASLLLAALNPAGEKSSSLVGGLHHCFVHQEDDGPWIEHLKKSVPPELKRHILFRKLEVMTSDKEVIYPTGTGAFQIRKGRGDGYSVWLWHPPGDRNEMAVYETWFWRETYRYFHERAAARLQSAGVDATKALPTPDLDKDDLWPQRQVHAALRLRAREL